MKLIVGLGNIGSEYEHTRHNAGFDAIDILAAKLQVTFLNEAKLKGLIAKVNLGGHKAILVKPTTYMNLSGECIKAVMNFYKIDINDLVVISDDIDMQPGKIRYRSSGSAGGQNGLKNIILHTGTEAFKRIKIGTGRDQNIPVVDWVLGHHNKDVAPIMDAAFNKVAEILYDYITDENDNHLATALTK